MRPRLRALLLILVLAPAAALGLLGLRSLDAGEEAARREARETAIRVRADLAAGLAREVRGRQLAVEAGTPSELAFRIAPGGAIVEPPTRSFPPRARSFSPGDLVAVRGVLERTDRELFAGGDPRAAVAIVLPALGRLEDEDLDAVLRDRAALALERAGEPEEALRLCRELFEDHPAARDLDGFPLAILAARRSYRLLDAAGRAEEAAAVRRALAAALAENPWSLPAERVAFLRRGLPSVPEELVYAAVRGIVAPGAAGGGGGWTTRRGHAAGPAMLVTWRRIDDGGIEGVVVPEERLAAALAARGEELSAVTGAWIRTDDDGEVPTGAEFVGGPLPAPFGGHHARVAVVPTAPAPWLAALWAGLCVLLLGGLASGVLLGLRAVRREVRLARMRQDVLDNVSHELRTPLASIRALAENLRDGAVPPDRAGAYFDALDRESRRVARLVDDVLDLSRLERGAAALRDEEIDPAALAREAVRELALDPGDFAVRLDVAPELPSIRGDADALRRALLNLLANAARYAREAGSAELIVDAENGAVRFAVRDRGPGIPPEDRGAVFERFHRVASDTHEVKGAGLGLPLARAVAEAHGGTIRLESEVGRGSTFTMEVPAT